MEEKKLTKKTTTAGKVLRIVFRTVLIIILIIATLAFLITTPPVQNMIRGKAVSWLSKKLNTKIEVGRIYIGFPKSVVLEGIYVEDRQGDTLLAGRSIEVDVSMLKLLRNEIELNEVQLSGITAKVKRVLPDTIFNFQFIIDAFATSDKAAIEDKDSASMKFSIGNIKINNTRLVYDDRVTGNDMALWIERLDTQIDRFDLANMDFGIDALNLSGMSANLRQRKPLTNAPPTPASEDAVSANEASVPIRITVGTIRLDNNNIQYYNEQEPEHDNGIDYAHLDIKALSLHADHFIYTPDSIAGSITKGNLTEKSGLQIKTLQTDFAYTAHQAFLHNLLLETPGTSLKKTVAIGFESLDAIQNNPGEMTLNVDIEDSRIYLGDVLIFMPELASQPAFSDAGATWTLHGRVTGAVKDLNIETLRATAFSGTELDISGTLKGLPAMENLSGDLRITTFRTVRRDVQMLLPANTLPGNITLPSSISARGSLRGSLNDATADISVRTDLGNISVRGSATSIANKRAAQYKADVRIDDVRLGTIMQNDSSFGNITGRVQASGRGFDPETATAQIDAVIQSAVLNRYNYQNVSIKGGLQHKNARLQLNIDDPNIRMHLQGNARIDEHAPQVKMDLNIGTFKTLPLNLTADTMEYSGHVTADFSNANPDNLLGSLTITGSQFNTGSRSLKADTIAVTADSTATGRFLRLRSETLTFDLSGKYRLTEMGSVFQRAVGPYFTMDTTATRDSLSAYDFNFTAQLVNSPLLQTFIPGLQRLDPVNLNAHFSSAEGWNASLDAPMIIVDENRVQDFTFRAKSGPEALDLDMQAGQISAGPSMTIYSTTLDAEIAGNKINFLLSLRDLDEKNKYRIGGILDQPANAVYALTLHSDSLLLNYDRWNIANDNLVKMDNGDINIRNLTLSRNDQQLSFNSETPQRNSPLNIMFKGFRIGTLTALAKQDSLLADGVINGNVEVRDLITQPVFTSELTVTDLMILDDTLGNLSMNIRNNASNLFTADINLTGKGNDLSIGGSYDVKPADASVINLDVDIQRFQVSSIEALSLGALTRGTGHLSGKIALRGTFGDPDIKGSIVFNKTGFAPTMLGSYFTIDKEQISVTNEGIHFDSFTVLDEAKNELSLDGNAFTTDFINYRFDMDLTADDFQALNSTKRNNDLFYGKFNFDTDLHISGTGSSPKIAGALQVNENTDFTVAIPQGQPGVVEREGIVRFVDMDSIRLDTSMRIAHADTLSNTDIKGMDISVNIQISKEAQLRLVLDEANGDNLTMKGTAELTGGIDPSGKTTLTGTYEIEEGSYEVSLNFLKRKFSIQQGSTITWLGEPTRADLDLTAIYVANTAPITLVENQVDVPNLNIYKQKLPFEVNLILKGDLLQPEISFDINLPDRDFNVDASVTDNVEARLTQLKGQPSELNKQVFALLLLNRFVSENPFASGGGGFNAGTVARQSVSQLLNDQLNNLAADLITGVDVNFNLESTEDYTTGAMENRTDLNVSLSKQLLNDRLRVTVGSNFELEGPQRTNQRDNNLAGNIAVDYLLSKDGRYAVRAYRKNEYEGELEGYIIETGLTFILTFDYDRLRELFHSRKEKTIQRENRDKEREINNKNNTEAPVSKY